MRVYIIGSLRNPAIPDVTNKLVAAGFDVFSDWFAAGERADDSWAEYEKGRGRSYREALASPAAQNVFAFDKRHLEAADAVVMVAPFGKSACIELGWSLGKGKPGFILMDEPGPDARWDVMLNFATGIAYTVDELVELMQAPKDPEWVYREGCPCVGCTSEALRR